MRADAFEAFSQNPEISDIIGFVHFHVHSDISVSHFSKDPAYVIDRPAQTVADMVNCLCDHTDFVISSIK